MDELLKWAGPALGLLGILLALRREGKAEIEARLSACFSKLDALRKDHDAHVLDARERYARDGDLRESEKEMQRIDASLSAQLHQIQLSLARLQTIRKREGDE